MVGTHTPHVYCLQAAYTTVILELYTRKITDCIGHRKSTQIFELLTRQLLYRNHLFHQRTAIYHKFIEFKAHRRGVFIHHQRIIYRLLRINLRINASCSTQKYTYRKRTYKTKNWHNTLYISILFQKIGKLRFLINSTTPQKGSRTIR